jgi:PIN domain
MTALPPPQRLRLKEGVQPNYALDVLRERAGALERLAGSITRGATPAETNQYVMRRRDGYLDWVEVTEGQLSNLTHDRTVLNLLYSTGYWAIRQLDPYAPRPIPLIQSEERVQKDVLERLHADLGARVSRATSAQGHISVLDTNTLLHFHPPDNIDWIDVVGEPAVRLVLPLRVVEELDAKKYGRSDKLRERARALLPQLERMVGKGGTPKRIADGVTLEIFVEPPPRMKRADADEEILDTCRELWELSGQAGDITLVTYDTAMRVRAETQGHIRAVKLPDKYRRDKNEPERPASGHPV